MASVSGLGTESVPVDRAVGRVCAADVCARVDSPSVDASMKDGYAIIARDIHDADSARPVRLTVIEHVAAGDLSARRILSGSAARVLTGAPIPVGADAVLPDEFVDCDGRFILARAPAGKGRNVLAQGTDVAEGEVLAGGGEALSPQRIGLLVAGGVCEVPVIRRPRIALLATGNEVLLPGSQLERGKLYASNVALQDAWFKAFGMSSRVSLAGDRADELAESVSRLLAESDVLITSGGAWKGERDLIVTVLKSMGLELLFHRVRMGPGKAVAMGLINGKPVFCLPGGPTSNEMAFLKIAFPAILKMAGFRSSPLLYLDGVLERDITGQSDWTQFVQCLLIRGDTGLIFRPIKIKSRLASIARTHALVRIPEGVARISAGRRVRGLVLDTSAIAPVIS